MGKGTIVTSGGPTWLATNRLLSSESELNQLDAERHEGRIALVEDSTFSLRAFRSNGATWNLVSGAVQMLGFSTNWLASSFSERPTTNLRNGDTLLTTDDGWIYEFDLSSSEWGLVKASVSVWSEKPIESELDSGAFIKDECELTVQTIGNLTDVRFSRDGSVWRAHHVYDLLQAFPSGSPTSQHWRWEPYKASTVSGSGSSLAVMSSWTERRSLSRSTGSPQFLFDNNFSFIRNRPTHYDSLQDSGGDLSSFGTNTNGVLFYSVARNNGGPPELSTVETRVLSATAAQHPMLFVSDCGELSGGKRDLFVRLTRDRPNDSTSPSVPLGEINENEWYCYVALGNWLDGEVYAALNENEMIIESLDSSGTLGAGTGLLLQWGRIAGSVPNGQNSFDYKLFGMIEFDSSQGKETAELVLSLLRPIRDM